MLHTTKAVSVILVLSTLVFSKGITAAHTGVDLLNTQYPLRFEGGVFFQININSPPANSAPLPANRAPLLPACNASCCHTTCPAAAGVTCTPGWGGAPGTCSVGTAAGCRSMYTTCAATACTLAATCGTAPAACTGPAGTAGSATVAPVC